MRVLRAAAPVLAAALVSTGLVTATALPASAAAAPSAEVAWVGKNVVTTDGGETAEVLVKYRCTGVAVHAWASAKQGPDLAPGTDGGTSSARAVSWREAPEPVLETLTCDGTWQIERITIQATPDTVGKDALTRGDAWVQFAMFVVDPASGQMARGGIGGALGGQWGQVVGNTAR